MASPLPDLKGFTILVIEDDPDGLQLLTTAITACGARVLTASDTTIARGHLDTVKLDLLVTDLGLPGETGRGVRILGANAAARQGRQPPGRRRHGLPEGLPRDAHRWVRCVLPEAA